MEGESGSNLTLADYLRSNFAQLDHWFYEESSYQVSSFESEEDLLAPQELWELDDLSQLSEWKQKRVKTPVPSIFFVDGRMKIHGRILVDRYLLLLAEVSAGFAQWEKSGGVRMGFSQDRPPALRKIIAAPEEIKSRNIFTTTNVSLLGKMVFSLEVSSRGSRYPAQAEAPEQAIFTAMQQLEKKVLLDLWGREENTPIIKDGIIRPDDPAFQPGVGPCGLVKRSESRRLPPSYFETLLQLGKGERTPFVCAYFPKRGKNWLRVYCFTRLVELEPYSPWQGIIRLEIAVEESVLFHLRDEISCFFDQLVVTLPTLTASYPWKRLPENLFPVIALEEHLGQYFSSSSWVQNLYRLFLRSE